MMYIKKIVRLISGLIRIAVKCLSAIRPLNYICIAECIDSREPHLLYDIPRSRMLHVLASMVIDSNVTGSFAELGVYRGDSARILNYYLDKRELILLDTFDGFDAEELRREKDLKVEEIDDFSDVSVADILCALRIDGDTENVVVKKGLFANTAKEIKDREYALVHIDCDLSEPIKQGLEFFYPRMAPGGVLIIHDYISEKYPGVKVVVDEFFFKKPERVMQVMGKTTGSAIVITNK